MGADPTPARREPAPGTDAQGAESKSFRRPCQAEPGFIISSEGQLKG